MLTIVKLLQGLVDLVKLIFFKTASEQRAKTVGEILEEQEKMKKTGRPTWSIILFWVLAMYGCTSFSYRYYGLNVEDIPKEILDQKRVLGPDPEHDQPLSLCLKKQSYNCVVMEIDQFYPMKTELEGCKIALAACERHQ